ncbi:hypothetical protein [Asticcacaulis sp.]|uniref:hypothetical protein n=1 Tax=Asticcacaulis sp. TaxID=1872648 RepID=UPI0026292126|nr:hypothetical protein [Asticcacaulis sp.]
MQHELDALKKTLFVENQVKNIKFFPGTNADTMPVDVAREINKFFADPASASVDED